MKDKPKGKGGLVKPKPKLSSSLSVAKPKNPPQRRPLSSGASGMAKVTPQYSKGSMTRRKTK